MADVDIIIRDAQREDCVQIRSLIQELADFEKMPDAVQIGAEQLACDGFDTEYPPYSCVVVEDKSSPGVIIGYAIFNTGYTIGVGKNMYLEDIMVTERYRGKGIGKKLFQRVCQEASKRDCVIINFVVLEWNPAVKFYKSFGAEDLTKKSNIHYFAMQKDKIVENAKKYCHETDL